MIMNKIIVPTGYMGSGSSAITDLISELEGYQHNNGSYEYVLMHCPDGLFDLEDKLLFGNNAYRSDEAVHRFISCMNDLYDKNYFWVGNYKHVISEKFLEYCIEFIEDLQIIRIKDVYWYYQQNPIGCKMWIHNIIRRIIGKISCDKIKINRAVKYKEMIIAIPDENKFYSAAQKFLNSIFTDLGYKNHNLVLDQLLLPQNLFRIEHYFGKNLYVLVVERDPRDVFLLNKYYWKPKGIAVPYSTDAVQFCKMYKKMRQNEKIVEDKRIFRVHFEDLIFRYEETIKQILYFLDVSPKAHVTLKKTKFNPDISINNTMLFRRNEYRTEETKIIEKELYQYLYNFPNIIPNNDIKNIF